jgi:hypothetical protein
MVFNNYKKVVSTCIKTALKMVFTLWGKFLIYKNEYFGLLVLITAKTKTIELQCVVKNRVEFFE